MLQGIFTPNLVPFCDDGAVNEPELRRNLIHSGLQTILARHTCAHRVDELLGIVEELR